MRPPSGTGPPGIRVQRVFDGNRLAKDSQTRAYQEVLPVVYGLETGIGVTGRRVTDREESLVSQEGVAA